MKLMISRLVDFLQSKIVIIIWALFSLIGFLESRTFTKFVKVMVKVVNATPDFIEYCSLRISTMLIELGSDIVDWFKYCETRYSAIALSLLMLMVSFSMSTSQYALTDAVHVIDGNVFIDGDTIFSESPAKIAIAPGEVLYLGSNSAIRIDELSNAITSISILYGVASYDVQNNIDNKTIEIHLSDALIQGEIYG